jgi:RNA binding exosome subunit
LSSKPQIGYITIRAFSHATEDPEKVQDAVRKTLPARIDTTAAFRKTDLTGHYGNPIILFEVKLTDKQAFPEVLEKIG